MVGCMLFGQKYIGNLSYSRLLEVVKKDTVVLEENEIPKKFWFYVAALEEVRKYNSEFPEESSLYVHTIDINHNPYSFITSLEFMQRFVKTPAILERSTFFLRKNMNDNKQYMDKLLELQNGISQNRTTYVHALEEKWVDRLDRMIGYLCCLKVSM